MAVATVFDQAKAPRQPIDLRSRLQSLINFDVDKVLSSNTLVSGQEERNWTTLLQAFWTVLQNADGTNKPAFPEDPAGGGERYPSFPEERDGKGGKARCTTFPQEPIEDDRRPQYPTFGGDGYWPEAPGGAGDD